MVLRTSSGAMHRHLNNNTPVNTEVLWVGGLWWGLWAGAPGDDDRHQIAHVDDTVVINVGIWIIAPP